MYVILQRRTINPQTLYLPNQEGPLLLFFQKHVLFLERGVFRHVLDRATSLSFKSFSLQVDKIVLSSCNDRHIQFCFSINAYFTFSVLAIADIGSRFSFVGPLFHKCTANIAVFGTEKIITSVTRNYPFSSPFCRACGTRKMVKFYWVIVLISL